MWFDNAYGKEKIKFIFNDELSLDDSILELILYQNPCLLSIRFRVDKIPSSIPKKWQERKFDFIDINIDFHSVRKFECGGSRIGFRCIPNFKWNNDKPILSIQNENFSLYCSADSMFIGEITPFHLGGD